MFARALVTYNTQVIHTPLIPRWLDAGLSELTPKEVNRVKEFYLSKLGFSDRSDRLPLDASDQGSFKLSVQQDLLNRPCEVSLLYQAHTRLWDASVTTPIKSLFDTVEATGFNSALQPLFKDYFHLSARAYSNIAFF